MNPIFLKLKALLMGGSGQFLEKAGTLIDNLTMSKEEKEQFKIDLIKMQNERDEKVLTAAQVETDAVFRDMADARNSNVKIQETEKASWMAKNIAYCIDAFVILLWGVLTVYLIGSALKIIRTYQVDLTGIYGLYAAVTGVAMTIINFHRGSSVGSKDNSEAIRKMMLSSMPQSQAATEVKEEKPLQ